MKSITIQISLKLRYIQIESLKYKISDKYANKFFYNVIRIFKRHEDKKAFGCVSFHKRLIESPVLS